jgi:hypothetical protein
MLTFDELSEWGDDSEWEEEQREKERGGGTGIKRVKGDNRRRLAKECSKDCYGECCLNRDWVWLRGSYLDDDARPDLFQEYRTWLHSDDDGGDVEDAAMRRRDSGKEIFEKE